MLSSLKRIGVSPDEPAVLDPGESGDWCAGDPDVPMGLRRPLAGLASRPGPARSLCWSMASPAPIRPMLGARQGESRSGRRIFPRPTAAERKLLDALEKTVDIDFDLPLGDSLDALESLAKVDSGIDKAKLNDEGVALDAQVMLK